MLQTIAQDPFVLYFVPTPIGNLEDMTLRALRILKEVDAIYCEDTRTSGVLLKHFQIQKPLHSLHAHNEHKELSRILERLKQGTKLAYISDAGTPGISDPGFMLARACKEENIPYCTLPGPTAFVPALLQSGFPLDRFVFEGFLPIKKGKQTRLKAIEQEERTVVLYESPHRIEKTLIQIVEMMGPDRKVSLSREISKMFEETITGSAAYVLERIQQKAVKGEIVLIIEGNTLKKTKDVEME